MMLMIRGLSFAGNHISQSTSLKPIHHPSHLQHRNKANKFQVKHLKAQKKGFKKMKGWDMMHRGVLLGMGSLTVIASYRSYHEYQKRIVINEQKEAARNKARAARRAAAQAAAEAQEETRNLRRKQMAAEGGAASSPS